MSVIVGRVVLLSAVLLLTSCAMDAWDRRDGTGDILPSDPKRFPVVTEPVQVQPAGVFASACEELGTGSRPLVAVIALAPGAAGPGEKASVHVCPGFEARLLDEPLQDARVSGDAHNFDAGIFTWRVNPDCVYMTVGGTRVLISGRPEVCRR